MRQTARSVRLATGPAATLQIAHRASRSLCSPCSDRPNLTAVSASGGGVRTRPGSDTAPSGQGMERIVGSQGSMTPDPDAGQRPETEPTHPPSPVRLRVSATVPTWLGTAY